MKSTEHLKRLSAQRISVDAPSVRSGGVQTFLKNATASPSDAQFVDRSIAPRHIRIVPHWDDPRTPLRHTWEGIVNVDQFRWLVRRDMQEQLELARRELRATHVRAVGMFDDEMRAFCVSPADFLQNGTRQARTNWQNIDYVIDSLTDRGLQPVYTTSFVPSAMASGATTVFTTKACTSPPRDWKQWESFVRESVRHCVERYSLEIVRTWPFEVWNEPNLNGWFWGGSQADFHRLWETTYRAIKSVDASLRVGGPSTARAEWLEEFLAHTTKQGCPPDYMIAHVYNNDSAVDHPLAPFDPTAGSGGNFSPTLAMDVMRGVRKFLSSQGFEGELHWNEWGRSFHAVDHQREHPSEAAFIARLLGEVSQEADVFSYWCISDIYDQVGFGREAFFGGYGLLSLQGLRKPAYHAFELMSRLGTERVGLSGTNIDATCNAIVTVSGRRAQVLVHADHVAGERGRQSLEVAVDLPRGSETGDLFRVDSSENNVLARWEALGKPVYLSRAQIRELAQQDRLHASTSPVRLEHDAAGTTARFVAECPGIALLEVTLPE